MSPSIKQGGRRTRTAAHGGFANRQTHGRAPRLAGGGVKPGRVGCGVPERKVASASGMSRMYLRNVLPPAPPCPHATPQPCFCSSIRRTCPRPAGKKV